MPPKVQQKETRSNEEIAIESAKNSSYNLMMPMIDAAHVRVRNPITGKDPHFSTSDDSFFSLLAEFSSKGLQSKIESEFIFFSQNYNPLWVEVHQKFISYITPSELNSEEEQNVSS